TQYRKRCAATEEDRVHVGSHGVTPTPIIHDAHANLFGRPYARVSHEEVQTAEPCNGVFDDSFAIGTLRQISAQRYGPATAPFNVFDDFLGIRLSGTVGDRHEGAGAGEKSRGGGPTASGSAGHESYLPLEVDHGPPPPRLWNAGLSRRRTCATDPAIDLGAPWPPRPP